MWWPTKVAFGLKSTSLQGIGLMCGTSQDGLDLADVRFTFQEGKIYYEVIGKHSFNLPETLQAALRDALTMDTLSFLQLDQAVGEFFGDAVSTYLKSSGSNAQFVASHGITSFHQPEAGITHQLGSGAKIASRSGLPVINGFRELDVALGGQGAPLVPYCDQLLFHDYDATLNLGGFANVTLLNGEHLLGFDVGPANLLLNHFADLIELTYDKGGERARRGQVIPELLEAWNKLPFYQLPPPKSLGKEWLGQAILDKVDTTSYATEDLLHTAVLHIAEQIGKVLDFEGKCLVTGGGAYNTFLMEVLNERCKTELILPKDELIEFKEAICFALLGALRWRSEQNTASSVTGARRSSSSGYLHLPPLEG